MGQKRASCGKKKVVYTYESEWTLGPEFSAAPSFLPSPHSMNVVGWRGAREEGITEEGEGWDSDS